MKTKGTDTRKTVRVFSSADDRCIWMRAGVVNMKMCDNAFDCTNCAFDKAMSRKAVQKPTALVSWREIKRGRPFFSRECRHMLTGRVQFKFCAHNYECKTCEFDQLLDDEDLSVRPSAVSTGKVAGFAMAEGYYYHKGHSWARIEYGGFVHLGIDDFAYRLLGTPTALVLPTIGSHIQQGESGWSIQRGEKQAAMLSPVSGTVMATNQNVLRRPELGKKDPYGEGWLVVLDPRGGLKKNVKGLLFENTATTWLNGEAKKLEDMVMQAYGVPLAATGGEVVEDIFGNLPHLAWESLVHEFLLT